MATIPEYPTKDPSSAVIACPYPFFDQARAETPVYRSPHRDEYLVFQHADIIEVLRNQELFSEVLPEGTLMDIDDVTMISNVPQPKHKEMRTYASRPLTPGRLRKMEPRIERIVDGLIDTFVDRGEVELMYDFALRLPAQLMCELMGLPTEGEEWELILGQWSATISDGRGTEYWPNLVRYFGDRIEERRARPTDDMLSELISLQIERDGDFNFAYVTVVATELMVGGAGTTALMMVNAMWCLLENPAQMAKVRADHSLIPAMLEESLRRESVIQDRERIATADTTIGGVPIPAGSRVRLLLGSANRDPDIFDDPERFDISRDRTEVAQHLGFGYGPHFCLGAPLARAEGKIAFERLFSRLGEIRLGSRNDFSYVPNTHYRSLQALHLEFDRVAG